MALVPIVTDISAHVATWNASGFINAIRAHILATSVTSHLAIDAFTTNEGLTIGFVAAGENQQVNLRKTAANTIAVSIEPAGTITDPGDSIPTAPTGTGADWSGVLAEPTWDVSWGASVPAAGSKVWCVETPDAFAIITTNTANTYHCHILHAGRILTSFNSSAAAAAGQDGLGFMCGVPDNGSGTVNDWMQNSAPCAMVHWATNEWSRRLNWASAPNSADVADTAHTAYRPLPPGIVDAIDINSQTSDPIYGPLKYIRCTPSGSTMTVIPDPGSNQGWLRYNDAVAASGVVESIIWDKTVTP